MRKEKKRRKSNVGDYEFGMIMNPHAVTDVVEELSRSSGYVILMSVMVDMLSANNEKSRNLIYNV